MTTKISRLTIDLPSREHRKIKMAASMMDISMKDLVLLSLDEFMHRKFNKVTEKAMKQGREGKNVKKFKNMEELFEDLGI
ncbi:MAG TPA: hypothetical protein VLG44_04395 [Chlamydiales bacterium]|nr:hypothetical protein [Chlamydiales bacterium]